MRVDLRRALNSVEPSGAHRRVVHRRARGRAARTETARRTRLPAPAAPCPATAAGESDERRAARGRVRRSARRRSGCSCVIHAKLEVVAVPRQRHRTSGRRRGRTRTARVRGSIDAGARERERAADRRMAGHRQLLARREDAHADVGARRLGRQHERRLGEVHLLGDRLHRLGRQPAAVEEDGELIAAEEMVGEDVVVKVAV